MLSRLLTCRRVSCQSTHPVIRGFATLAENNNNTPDVASSSSSSLSSGEETKHRLATIRLYRILQRTCRSFPVEKEQDPILLQPVLKLHDWGRHSIFKPPSPTSTIPELLRLFYVMVDEADDWSTGELTAIEDWFGEVVGKTEENELPPLTTMTCWTTTSQLQDAVRTAFRVSYDRDLTSPGNLRAWAIRAVQLLQEQQVMWSHSSCKTTQGVRVTATSRYGTRTVFDIIITFTVILMVSSVVVPTFSITMQQVYWNHFTDGGLFAPSCRNGSDSRTQVQVCISNPC